MLEYVIGLVRRIPQGIVKTTHSFIIEIPRVAIGCIQDLPHTFRATTTSLKCGIMAPSFAFVGIASIISIK